MKKKGFTLIELLAVIIVIAVIAIITIPTILGVIDKSKRAAYKDSIYGIIDSARIYLATNQEYINGEIEFVCNGINCSRQDNGDNLLFKGTVPKSGSIYLQSDGSILVESVYNGKYYANNETGEVVITEADTTLTRGELTELVKQLQTKVNELQSQINHKADSSNISDITNKHNSDVINLNNVIDGHTTELTNLQTDLANKAALSHTHDDKYYTEGEIDSKINSINNKINNIQATITPIDKVYPVGSIYISVSSVNPGSLFPGTTWVVWGAGRVPVGVDTSQAEFNYVEKIGGEKTHTLNIAEMPSHSHGIRVSWADGNTGNVNFDRSTSTTASSFKVDQASTTSNSGATGAHNNLQPYITTYMWKRVS